MLLRKVYGRLFPFVISEYHIEKCGKCTRTIQCLYYVLICKHQHKHPPFRKGSGSSMQEALKIDTQSVHDARK